MKKTLEFLSFLLIAGGISGLIHEWNDGFVFFGFMRNLPPEGWETQTYIAFVVLGAVSGVASVAMGRVRR
jgi:hypothetical protein